MEKICCASSKPVCSGGGRQRRHSSAQPDRESSFASSSAIVSTSRNYHPSIAPHLYTLFDQLCELGFLTKDYGTYQENPLENNWKKSSIRSSDSKEAIKMLMKSSRGKIFHNRITFFTLRKLKEYSFLKINGKDIFIKSKKKFFHNCWWNSTKLGETEILLMPFFPYKSLSSIRFRPWCRKFFGRNVVWGSLVLALRAQRSTEPAFAFGQNTQWGTHLCSCEAVFRV